MAGPASPGGRPWQAAESGKALAFSAGSGSLWQAVAGSLAGFWQALAGSGIRLWQALAAGSGRLWQQAPAGSGSRLSGALQALAAGSGRLWQALAGSGRLALESLAPAGVLFLGVTRFFVGFKGIIIFMRLYAS